MGEDSFLIEKSFQKIRSFLFYLSLIIFFLGLPFILAFALGFKFNSQSLRFVKTGLIYLKTQPEGAKIYLNGKLYPEKTPASIAELLPGVYKVVLELPGHYSWKAEVDVEAGKANRIDKIIFFPLRPILERLNLEKFSSFRIDAKKKMIYYLDQDKKIIYRSNFEANNFEDIASLPEYFTPIDDWNVSPDKKKFFAWNTHQIVVMSLDLDSAQDDTAALVFLDYEKEKITNVFWHSDSFHLVVLTNRYIQVIEARSLARPINLIELNKEQVVAFYDEERDILFFADSLKATFGKGENNLYKLELGTNAYIFDKLVGKQNP